MYNHRKRDSPITSVQSTKFKASGELFYWFNNQNSIPNVVGHGGAKNATGKFFGEFKKFVENEKFTLNQLF